MEDTDLSGLGMRFASSEDGYVYYLSDDAQWFKFIGPVTVNELPADVIVQAENIAKAADLLAEVVGV